MRRRSSPVRHRAGGIPIPTTLTAGAALLVVMVVLPVVLPHDQATAVVGMVCSVASSVVSAWLNHRQPRRLRVRRRSRLR